MDKRPFTCCFTGHRILPAGQEEEIWRRVYACLEPLLEEGVRYFGVGGALGFDTLVAEKLLALRESRPQIRIILGWNETISSQDQFDAVMLSEEPLKL